MFEHIIALNEELGKPMPVVKAHTVHEMASEANTIVRLLDIVRGSGQRFPDIAARLNSEHQLCTTARANMEPIVSSLGGDNAPYEACAKVLDEVKQIILHLVKMLEIADETFVRNIHERVKRCDDLLGRLRAADSAAQVNAMAGAVRENHSSVQRAVDNRLPLIEDPTPNSRLRDAMAAVKAGENALLSGSAPASECDAMARKLAELREASAYRPPIVF